MPCVCEKLVLENFGSLNFWMVGWHPKIFVHRNYKFKILLTPKFPNLQYRGPVVGDDTSAWKQGRDECTQEDYPTTERWQKERREDYPISAKNTLQI